MSIIHKPMNFARQNGDIILDQDEFRMMMFFSFIIPHTSQPKVLEVRWRLFRQS